MSRLKLFFAILALTFTVCAYAQHTTKLILPHEKDGSFVRLYNFDTNELIDSLPINNEEATFASNKHPECVIRLKTESGNAGDFILTDADIEHRVKVEEIENGTRWTWEAKGGVNDSITALKEQLNLIGEKFRSAESDEDKAKAIKDFSSAIYNAIDTHGNDLLGYRVIVMGQSNLSLAELEGLVGKYPTLVNYKQVRGILERRNNQEAVSVGKKFKDFTVAYDGVEHKLSDVVGHGDYVLLDFWASWCGPCRAAMPEIKSAFEKYKDSNFKVLGVAISDEPTKSLESAKNMELPWEIWVNGGESPMKTYNVTAIPLLILFGPDGTILERGIAHNNLLPTLEKHIPSGD